MKTLVAVPASLAHSGMNMRTKSLFTVLSCLVLFGCSQGEQPQPQAKAETSSSEQTASTAQPAETAQPQINADEVMQQVQKYFKEGNYRAAFPLLDQLHAAKQCPAEGYAIRAQILDHSGLLSQAVTSMTVALSQQPQNAEWHNMLGLLFVKGQNLPMAQQAFTKAVELQPKFSKAYNNRGLMFIAMKEYAQAINDFDQAIQHESGYVDAHNNRGYAYLEQSNYEKAVENFTAAITNDPVYVKGYNNRGFALMKMGDAEKAVADFTKAIELSPEVVKHYMHRRDAWLAMGNQAEADKDQAEAQWMQKLLLISRKVQREPQNPALLVERAEHYAAFGRYDQAFLELSAAEKLDETFAKIYHCRGNIHYTKKEYQAAIDNCTKALEYDQDFAARSLRGDAYLAAGKFDKAIEDYAAAQRFDGTVASAYMQRSEQRKKQGDNDGAEQDRQTALQLDPSLKETETK